MNWSLAVLKSYGYWLVQCFTMKYLDVKGDEYARLWKFATEQHPPYLNYQKIISRHIPIVVFQSID